MSGESGVVKVCIETSMPPNYLACEAIICPKYIPFWPFYRSSSKRDKNKNDIKWQNKRSPRTFKNAVFPSLHGKENRFKRQFEEKIPALHVQEKTEASMPVDRHWKEK